MRNTRTRKRNERGQLLKTTARARSVYWANLALNARLVQHAEIETTVQKQTTRNKRKTRWEEGWKKKGGEQEEILS